MCTVLLLPGVNPTAVNKYIIISYIISYHIISYQIIPYHTSYQIKSYHIIYRIKSSYIISYHIISYHITVPVTKVTLILRPDELFYSPSLAVRLQGYQPSPYNCSHLTTIFKFVSANILLQQCKQLIITLR